ncbi:Hypothetical protein NocV09_02200040 [Nannochloropsis oceanica]
MGQGQGKPGEEGATDAGEGGEEQQQQQQQSADVHQADVEEDDQRNEETFAAGEIKAPADVPLPAFFGDQAGGKKLKEEEKKKDAQALGVAAGAEEGGEEGGKGAPLPAFFYGEATAATATAPAIPPSGPPSAPPSRSHLTTIDATTAEDDEWARQQVEYQRVQEVQRRRLQETQRPEASDRGGGEGGGGGGGEDGWSAVEADIDKLTLDHDDPPPAAAAAAAVPPPPPPPPPTPATQPQPLTVLYVIQQQLRQLETVDPFTDDYYYAHAKEEDKRRQDWEEEQKRREAALDLPSPSTTPPPTPPSLHPSSFLPLLLDLTKGTRVLARAVPALPPALGYALLPSLIEHLVARPPPPPTIEAGKAEAALLESLSSLLLFSSPSPHPSLPLLLATLGRVVKLYLGGPLASSGLTLREALLSRERAQTLYTLLQKGTEAAAAPEAAAKEKDEWATMQARFMQIVQGK